MRWSLLPQQATKDFEWKMKLFNEGRIKTKPKRHASEAPKLFPDLFWVWEAYCFLSERRGVGQNGPLPITTSDIAAYSELTGRVEPHYRRQLLRFIPPLDRVFLKDFYDRQSQEIEKMQRKNAAKTRKR